VWDGRVHETKVLLDSGEINKAVKAFAQARRIAPPGVAAESWFSRELLRKVNLVTSHDLDQPLYYSLRAAVKREEEFGNASVLLAAKMIADGRREEAGAALRRTILEFPNWELPRRMLSVVQPNTKPGKE
jgi:cytochrome c-type biogenesis protein CcmH/NrfG